MTTSIKPPRHIRRAIDRATNADRAYFEAHPDEDWYIRPAQRREFWGIPDEGTATHVIVVRGDHPALRWRVGVTVPPGADMVEVARSLIGEIAVTLTTRFGQRRRNPA